MDYQPLQYIYQASGQAGAYTLLLLHGTGGDEYDLLPLAKHFGTDLNVLSLRGNVSEQGMPRFFKRLSMGIFDEKDLAFRTEEMVSFLKQLAEKEGFDIHKIIALGYSNGANIAGSILLLHPGLLAGAILYRPMQPFKVFPEVKDTQPTPVFMSNGLLDPTIQQEDTVSFVQHMQEAGFQVNHQCLPNGHNLTPDDVKLSVDWFHKNFNHGSL